MSNGCGFVREGVNLAWWINPEMNIRSAVPGHTEIKNNLVIKPIK
ncbi:MAG: type II toxin-antitoxin system HicA family toxin [Candidatus Anammoxibacter sp.]